MAKNSFRFVRVEVRFVYVYTYQDGVPNTYSMFVFPLENYEQEGL